jgi:hypothetical protein
MLGKTIYVPFCKYLQNKDGQLFYALLCKIGEGTDWATALTLVYQLTPFQLVLRTVWQIIGSYVFALMIIISLAWLGKHGYITRFVQKLQSSRSPNK